MNDFPLGAPTNRDAGPRPPEPIPGRPNWFRRSDGTEFYVEPAKPDPQGTFVFHEYWHGGMYHYHYGPADEPPELDPGPETEPTRGQRQRLAGFTRRPTWRSLPSDE